MVLGQFIIYYLKHLSTVSFIKVELILVQRHVFLH